jgi:hypothetical protein
MPFVYLQDLIDKKDTNFIPEGSNYLIKSTPTYHGIKSEIIESYSEISPTCIKVSEHLSIINPDSNCVLKLTDEQLNKLIPNK